MFLNVIYVMQGWILVVGTYLFFRMISEGSCETED